MRMMNLKLVSAAGILLSLVACQTGMSGRDTGSMQGGSSGASGAYGTSGTSGAMPSESTGRSGTMPNESSGTTGTTPSESSGTSGTTQRESSGASGSTSSGESGMPSGTTRNMRDPALGLPRGNSGENDYRSLSPHDVPYTPNRGNQ